MSSPVPFSISAAPSPPPPPPPPRAEKRNFSMFSAEAMRRAEVPGDVSTLVPTVPSIHVEPAPLPGPPAADDSGSLGLRLKRSGSGSLTDERDELAEKRIRMTSLNSNPETSEEKLSDDKDVSRTAVTEATRGNRFLRPTSLPLKPGTFTPKRHLITPNVLSLVSPETPRPKKSYGQLYLNGHAYTYLGLKCSTRPYFCTLNRLQPTYVPLSPDHNKLSMYSNWKVYDPDPDPCGLTPNQMIALYDSRHRPAEYSVSGLKTNVRLTHSSYWLTRVKHEPDAALDVAEGVNAPKRIKICAGGFESSEEYTYIRGRGRGRYVCEECGIRCKKPSMLKKHIRTHTDVRPFTCRHCSFSFKTKGNLTKHMKSKAHYKKCKEEGIDPVPTVVDDSYIDEACLARQQALRGEGHEDSDDDEDEEDDDDDEEEDDDDDEAEDDIKGRQEREAARSLLSLAQTPHHSPNNDLTTEKEAREAGLVAPKGACSLSTYPYQLSSEHPRRITSSIPGTPTLAPISEHKEREKVSHNTGLARDIHEQGIHLDDGAKPLAELNTEDGHQRYYFPSSRIVGSSSTLTDTIKQESKDVDGVDSTNSDDTSSKPKGSTISSRLPSALLTALPMSLMPRTPTTPISEILTPVSEPAFLLASICSTMEKLPLSLSTPTDPPEDSALHQTYLRERAVQDARVKQSQYHPRSREERSDKDTPVVMLGTPTSCITPTMSYSNALSHTDTVRTVMCSTTFTSVSHMISSQNSMTAPENPILRPPPLLWAVQKTSKISDSDPRLVTSSNVKVSASITSASSSLHSNLTSTPPPVSIKQENVQSPVKLAPVPLTMHSSSTVQAIDKRTRTLSEADGASDKTLPGDQIAGSETTADIKPESFQPSPVGSEDKQNATLSVITTVSASGNDVSSGMPLSEESSSTVTTSGSRPPSNSVIVANSGSTSPPQTSGAVVKKPKAEFMPPSSGPAPSYVSVTDDGRSKCTICNKVFSKPSQLHLHVNIHYFERPFRCDACVVSFRTRGHLQKHERSVSHHNKVSMNSTFGTPTTTNPRPYKCDDCKSAFRIHGHLAKHLRSKMHIMKLECVGKLPFGTYAEIERAGLNMNDIDTTDCDSSLESLLALAKKLDPSKLNQWKQPEATASDIEESSDEGEPIMFHGIPFPDVVDTGDEDNATSNTPQSEAHQTQQQPPPQPTVQQLQQNQLQHLPPRISSPNTTPPQQSGPSAVKQDAAAPRTNTTAAAAAAAAVAAAAAAASAPASRVFSGMPAGGQNVPPPPGSNGVPTYMSTTVKMDVQPSDKPPLLTHLPGLIAGRYNSVNSHSIILNNKDVNPEIKSVQFERRLAHMEQTHDLQDKTAEGRTGVCEVPNKTDIAYGGQSLQPPAHR